MQASDYTDPLLFWQNIADQYVYFIQAGDDGPVKIGRAKNPVKRLASLQTGSPTTLHLRHIIPGDHALESALHRRFRDAHVAGEWFGREWTAVILAYAEGIERAAIDAYDWSGEPPMLTGNEFRSMKELLALRAELERLRLAGFSTDEILRWARLTPDEYADQLHAMRRTGIYDMRHWRSGCEPTRDEAIAAASTGDRDEFQPAGAPEFPRPDTYWERVWLAEEDAA